MADTSSDTRKSALVLARNAADSLSLPLVRPGHGARTAARGSARTELEAEFTPLADSPLGEPLNIRQVARLIGCSAWSVRQRHIPQGLPYFRSRPSGKLTFYRDQVVRWILDNQIEGRNWK